MSTIDQAQHIQELNAEWTRELNTRPKPKRVVLPLKHMLLHLQLKDAPSAVDLTPQQLRDELQMALHAWSTVILSNDITQSPAILLGDYVSRFLRQDTAALINMPPDSFRRSGIVMWETLFLALAPYIRAVQNHEKQVIDHMRLDRMLGEDAVIEVNFLHIW